jgi:hypothetical protein
VPERKRDEVTLASKNHKRPGRIRDVGLPPWKDGFPNDTHKYLQVGKRRPAEEENVRLGFYLCYYMFSITGTMTGRQES